MWLLLRFVCVQPVIKRGLLSLHPSQESYGLAQSTVTTCTVSPPGFQRNLQTLANSLAVKGVISRLLQGPEQNSSIPYWGSPCGSVQCSLLFSPRMSSLVCPGPAPQSSAPTFSQTETFNLPGNDGSLWDQTLGWLPLSQNCFALLPGRWLEQVIPFSSRQHPFKAALFCAMGATLLIWALVHSWHLH